MYSKNVMSKTCPRVVPGDHCLIITGHIPFQKRVTTTLSQVDLFMENAYLYQPIYLVLFVMKLFLESLYNYVMSTACLELKYESHQNVNVNLYFYFIAPRTIILFLQNVSVIDKKGDETKTQIGMLSL